MKELFAEMSSWMRPYLTEIASAYVVTILAIYGEDINRLLKNKVRKYPWIVKTMAFIALCSIGYTLMTVAMVPVIRKGLEAFGGTYIAPITIVFYIVIGILASQKKQI